MVKQNPPNVPMERKKYRFIGLPTKHPSGMKNKNHSAGMIGG